MSAAARSRTSSAVTPGLMYLKSASRYATMYSYSAAWAAVYVPFTGQMRVTSLV